MMKSVITVEELMIFDLFDSSSEHLGFFGPEKCGIELIDDNVLPLHRSFEFERTGEQIIESSTFADERDVFE